MRGGGEVSLVDLPPYQNNIKIFGSYCNVSAKRLTVSAPG